jgi:hypothetical protein
LKETIVCRVLESQSVFLERGHFDQGTYFERKEYFSYVLRGALRRDSSKMMRLKKNTMMMSPN